MSILKYKDPKTGEFKRINPYKADLSFVGKDGIVVNKAANSEMVEISGSGCVQKDTSPFAVYGTDGNGDALNRRLTANPVPNAVAQYSNSGRLSTDTPINDLNCTNKKYVADNYVEKVKFTNLEQALNGYILDTTKEAYADLDSAVLKNSVAVGDNVYPIADKTRALVTQIEGKTTKMVQVLDKSTYYGTSTNVGITATNNGDGSWTINGTATESSYINFSSPLSLNDGHKVLLTGNKTDSGFTLGLLNQQISDTGNGSIGNIKAGLMRIWGISWRSGAVINNVTITPQLFDLTAMNREDITTVEQFKAEFPELYPYENGNIYPAKIGGVKFTGKNLFDLYTPEYGGESSFVLNGDKIVVSQTTTDNYVSVKFELPNAKFLIGKKISVSAKVKTSDKNHGMVRVMWVKNLSAVDTPGMNIISKGVLGETETNVSASGIVLAPPDGALKLCLLLYSNADGNLSETKTYTATYSDIQVEISDAPTAYEPYIEPVSVTLPKTYDLHGIGDYKDYLEITKNEDNELYTLKKVQVIDKRVFDGTEAWKTYTSIENHYNVDVNGILFGLNINPIISNHYPTNKIPNAYYSDINYAIMAADGDRIRIKDVSFAETGLDGFKAYLAAQFTAGTPVTAYYALATPVETVIARNLTYEQVTAIRHNGGLIEVEDNTNKGYARPTVTNTIVYRLTATNTAEG